MKKLSILLLMIFGVFTISKSQSLDSKEENNLRSVRTTNNIKIPAALKKKKAISNIKREPLLNSEVSKVEGARSFYTDRQSSIREIKESKDSVLFLRPQGFFFSSYNRSGKGLVADVLFGPARDTVQWRNISGGVTNYIWSLPDPGAAPDATGATTETNIYIEENPKVKYPFNVFNSNPTLSATGSEGELTYSLGSSESTTYLLTGGSISSNFGTGACNYDYHKGLVNYTTSETSFAFGSTSDHSIDGVANYFEKPIHGYVLDTIWISAAECEAPAGTEFKLIVHSLDNEGYLNDTIATATTTIEKVEKVLVNENPDIYIFNVVFDDFYTYDAELGFDVTKSFLEINSAILIELKGFNKDGVTFSVFAQTNGSSPVNENNAFIIYNNNSDDRVIASYKDSYTSLTFNLNMHYSYLISTENYYNASEKEESKTFILTSSYLMDSIYFVKEFPDWLNYEAKISSDSKEFHLTLKTSELPDEVAIRKDTVWLALNEAICGILVTQEKKTTSIENIGELENIRLTQQRGVITAVYPETYNSLSVFDITGRTIENHELPATGTFSFVPDVPTGKGIYFFRFTGWNNKMKTLKLIY